MLIDFTDPAISNIVCLKYKGQIHEIRAFYLMWNDFEVKTSEYTEMIKYKFIEVRRIVIPIKEL